MTRARLLPPVSALLLALPGVLGACASSPFGHRAVPSPKLDPAARLPDDPVALLEAAPSFRLGVSLEDAVVRVVGPQMTCSGTVFDERLVLTAHHCLVRRTEKGEFTKDLVPPDTVRVEFGGDYFAYADVRLTAIVAPPCGEAGGRGDIAVLVLERKLVGFPTMTLRRDDAPHSGEELDPMGFGHCALSGDGIRRRAREGGAIRTVASGSFLLDASICPGDSGGPLLRRGSNEVVGIVSMSAMDADESTRGLSLAARLDGFGSVFSNAREIANGKAADDLPPPSCEP
jgi:Trypsin